jgi:hypothetical protein
LSARRRPSVYRSFDTPGRCVPVPYSSSSIRPVLAIPSKMLPRLNEPSLLSREEVSCPRSDRYAFFASHLCGLFLPQRDPENHVRGRARIRKPNLAEGAALARRKGFPAVFRAALVQTFATLALRPAPGGRYPSLAPCRPAFARRRSACRYMPRMA